MRGALVDKYVKSGTVMVALFLFQSKCINQSKQVKIMKNESGQSIHIVTEAKFSHDGSSFYQNLESYPEKYPKRIIQSVQVLDTENRPRRAIILYSEIG